MDSRDTPRATPIARQPAWRRLVVGLGNPGRRYHGTRHNVGFTVVDLLRAALGGSEWRAFHRSELAEGRVAGPERGVSVVCVKPGAYMNRSGEEVQRVATEFTIAPPDILVIHDDLDLPAGKIRLRARGTSGGHRGVEDIIRVLGEDFHRLRIGIARPQPGESPEEYVLRRFEPEESAVMEPALARAELACRIWAVEDIDAAMNQFNPDAGA